MKPTKVVLRINGGTAYAAFLVYAETQSKAQVTAQIHLASATGLDVYKPE